MSESTSTPALTPEYLAQDRGYVVRDVVITFTVLLVVATALRTWSRFIQKTRLVWADAFIALSLLFNLATYTSLLLGVRYGAGRHVVTLTPDDLLHFAKTIWFAIPVCYIITVVWPKLAILDLYLHIFINKAERRASYACGLILILNATICGALTIGQCRPIQKTWNPTLPGFCINTSNLFVWTTFANILTDAVMLVIPVPAILKLQRKWQTKAGILLTFAVAGLGLAISIVRFYQFYTSSIHASTPDPTYNVITVFIWTIVEPGTYHLVACFLTYQTLFRWIARKNYFSHGWSRVSSWLTERSASKSSSVMTTSADKLSPRSSTSQLKQRGSHTATSEVELESGELYGTKRGYIAKIEAQGSHPNHYGISPTSSEGDHSITVKQDVEVRSETASSTPSTLV